MLDEAKYHHQLSWLHVGADRNREFG